MKLTESSEVLKLVGGLSLGLESLLGGQIMADWVHLGEGLGGGLTIAVREKVLGVYSLDVASVPGHSRLVDHVLWTAHPVLALSRMITVNHFVVVILWRHASVHLDGLKSFVGKLDWVDTLVPEDLSLDVAAGCSESLVFGGDMASISCHELLLEFSCNFQLTHLLL